MGSLSGLWAAPYSHLSEIDSQPGLFLAQRLVKHQKITYCIANPDAKRQTVSADNLSLLVEAAMREWTYGIALRIRQAGRAEEMQDILKLLEQPLTLQRLPSCDLTKHTSFSSLFPHFNPRGSRADIMFILSERYCSHLSGRYTSFFDSNYPGSSPYICLGAYASSPIQKTNPLPQIYEVIGPFLSEQQRQALAQTLPLFRQVASGKYTYQQQQDLWMINRLFEYDGQSLFSIITHELGHAFGLADEYLQQRPPQYASRSPGENIMADIYQPISCDEVDGMITLLDRFSGTKRTFASFCPGRANIINGTEQNALARVFIKKFIKQIQTDRRHITQSACQSQPLNTQPSF